MFDFLAVFLRCREAARLLQTTSENSSSAALRQRVTINSREEERVAFCHGAAAVFSKQNTSVPVAVRRSRVHRRRCT